MWKILGTFTVKVTAVGSHGCQREAKDGEVRTYCGNSGCPDCMAKKLVEDMRSRGMIEGHQEAEATLTHWPGTASEVVDDLLTDTRKGSFL
jgi:hypothetical protein